MNQAKATMNVRHISEQTSVIDIHGEVTSAAESLLMESYAQSTSRGSHNIILNFKDLEYMNSSGIGLLVTLLIRVQRQKQRLIACGLKEHYQQIFDLTRLNEAIAIYSGESEALTALGG